jgi:hypothetical protein
MALLFEKHVVVGNKELTKVVEQLRSKPSIMWESFVELILAKKSLKEERSWPTLLKSGSFYRDVAQHLKPHWEVERG